MLVTSLMLLIASRAGLGYGVGTDDVISVFLTPFQTLNAEYLPVWFSRRGNRRFFSPGFTGNYMLLMWAVLGNIITLAFLCNLRAMILKPVFQKPIDSTKDIFTEGKIPINSLSGSRLPEYLKTSRNEWEGWAGNTGYACKSLKERERALVQKVYEEDSHVLLLVPVEILSFLELEYFKDKELPLFHISRESFL